ncbi:HAD family hydrolase [Aquibacillus koreensis]|uniref:HAD family hydrolase n=1 Tax=Aquibacillus koreensis TaxID=279446 RepID=A0A9X3WSS9_9BACI|nr:HAD family hydrolase [Aquibacillus koreensis]MCT2535267.1 HAD family hydrolase [Aquibacillus koreensis]MDC3422774.1 HAD family hydrolase [Aquibacillus koreensis]
MNNFKILFLDIDGTILKTDHTIEDSTKEAIKQVKADGMEVFLATGRPIHEIYDIAEELDIHSFIGYNGAYAMYKDEVVFNEPMQRELIEQYVKIAKENDHEMVLYTKDSNHFTSLDTNTAKEFINYFDLRENKLLHKDVMDEILGITMMNVKEEEPLLYDIPETDIYFSPVNVLGITDCYDVIRENVSKGRAIKAVLERINISQREAIAFGDGMNDKQMLQYVGESFAMGNAHPELFQYAKHRTTSVSESGIYNGLKSLGLVK